MIVSAGLTGSGLRALMALGWLALVASGSTAEEVSVGPPAEWVVSYGFHPDSTTVQGASTGGIAYLLVDSQENVLRQQRYRHTVMKVLARSGIQEASHVSVVFDPAFQSARFHYVRVHRLGRAIEKLTPRRIETFQREESMERHLFDGTLTAVVNLTDIRAGDIVEYAYTVEGYNPLHGGGYGERFTLQFAVPVREIVVRVVADSARPLAYRLHEGAVEPRQRSTPAGFEYLWRLRDVEGFPVEAGAPDWQIPCPMVSFSTWSDWTAVAAWALPLYELAAADMTNLQTAVREIMTAGDRDARILQAIQFVQDEVRYLGFEGGLGAYQPHPPPDVLANRYGDCKDKSLLLVALLRSADVAAYPVLVNTAAGNWLEQCLPGPHAFDHCIVGFERNGRTQFVDPAAAGQGGDLDHLDRPPWARGLLVKPGAAAIVALPDKVPSRTHVTVNIDASDIESDATMSVVTRYTGTGADVVRSGVEGLSRDDKERSSKSFYADVYPAIRPTAALEITFDDPDSANVFELREEYSIPGFWQESPIPPQALEAEVWALDMTDLVGWSAMPDRRLPLVLGWPFEKVMDLEVVLPADWSIEEDHRIVEDEAYRFELRAHQEGDRMKLEYQYALLKDHVPADAVAKLVADHQEIEDYLAYRLTEHDTGAFRLNWFAVILLVFAIGVGVLGAVWLNRVYDPGPARGPGAGLPIRGWLILPAANLVIGLVRYVITLVSATEYFDFGLWRGLLDSSASDFAAEMLAGMVVEIVFQGLMVVFIGLLVVQFFRRRSSLPRLFIVNIVVALVFGVVSAVLLARWNDNGVMDVELGEAVRDALGLAVFAVIWIPYFLTSKRVKATFVATRRLPDETDEPVCDGSSTVEGAPSDLLKELAEAFPELGPRQLGEDSGLGAALLFPQGEELSRSMTVSCEGDEAIHLTVGAAGFSWRAGEVPQALGQGAAAIRGLLTGSHRLVEHLRDREAVAVDLQLPRGDGWHTVKEWRRKRGFFAPAKDRRVVHLRTSGRDR